MDAGRGFRKPDPGRDSQASFFASATSSPARSRPPAERTEPPQVGPQAGPQAGPKSPPCSKVGTSVHLRHPRGCVRHRFTTPDALAFDLMLQTTPRAWERGRHDPSLRRWIGQAGAQLGGVRPAALPSGLALTCRAAVASVLGSEFAGRHGVADDIWLAAERARTTPDRAVRRPGRRRRRLASMRRRRVFAWRRRVFAWRRRVLPRRRSWGELTGRRMCSRGRRPRSAGRDRDRQGEAQHQALLHGQTTYTHRATYSSRLTARDLQLAHHTGGNSKLRRPS